MATEVYERLLIGGGSDCATGLTLPEGEAMVHACKSPCHQRAVGYTKSLAPTHPHYLHCEYANDLFLNLIDPPLPLFKPESFSIFRRFIAPHYRDGRRVTIHCNQGLSRAPALALFFLSKELGVIGSETYDAAKHEFLSLYSCYAPGAGIETFLRENWSTL